MCTPKLAVALCVFSFAANAYSACQDRAYRSGYEYDARAFLTETERNSFNRIYPQFDEQRVEKNWEWRDIDPLAFFSADENRKRRREMFLFDLSPSAMNPKNDPPTVDQEAFRRVVSKDVMADEMLIDRRVAKIIVPYTKNYDDKFPICNFLEKLTSLGLRWSQVGGTTLHVYNGAVLLGSYSSGTVRLANLTIDKPPIRATSHK